MDSGSGAGMTRGKVDKCEGKGTDCGSGSGMTRGKVGKCEGKGTDCGSGGEMTRVRQVGDGASPRFLAGPRNDAVVGVCAGIAGMRESAGGGLASAFEEASSVLVAVTIA